MYNSTLLPTIYVLMRTYKPPMSDSLNMVYYGLLEDAIRSVENNSKVYQGHVKLIINDDSPKKNELYVKHKERLFGILKQHDFCVQNSNLIFSETDAMGSSYATYVIRKQFLQESYKNSDSNAIAVSLDQDDELIDNSLVSIANEMYKTGSNICISSYETKDDSNLGIIKDNGKSHNEVALQLYLKPRTISESKETDLLINIDTLGWTKSWLRDTMQQFWDCEMMFVTKFRGSAESYFSKYRAYEDFLDTIVLFKKEVKLCGTPAPTHKYKKQPQSITSSPTIEAFREDRAASLVTLNDLAYFISDQLVKEFELPLRNFIINKIRIIERILLDYREKYAKEDDPQYINFAKEVKSGYFIHQLCQKASEMDALKKKENAMSLANLASLFLCPQALSKDELYFLIREYVK